MDGANLLDYPFRDRNLRPVDGHRQQFAVAGIFRWKGVHQTGDSTNWAQTVKRAGAGEELLRAMFYE
jgi:hypothetical protein